MRAHPCPALSGPDDDYVTAAALDDQPECFARKEAERAEKFAGRGAARRAIRTVCAAILDAEQRVSAQLEKDLVAAQKRLEAAEKARDTAIAT